MPTTIQIYVDPDAGGTGSGADWTNAYTSLSAAEANEVAGTGNVTGANLAANDQIAYFNLRSSSGTADTSGTTQFGGWTTDATRYIVIDQINNDDHGGAWNTSAYRNVITDTFNANIEFQAGAEYARVLGVQCQNDGAQSSASRCIWMNTGANTSSEFHIFKNICRTNWAGTPSGSGGLIDFTADVNVYCINNVVWGNYNIGINLGFNSTAIERAIYNNTCYGTSNAVTGIACVGNAASTRLFNNATAGAHSTGGITVASSPTTGTNGTSDTSSPDGATYESLSFSFSDTGNGDFHLTAATPESGTDLSSDAFYMFSDDIDGDTRSTWDLGMDEFIGTGSPTISPPTGPYYPPR